MINDIPRLPHSILADGEDGRGTADRLLVPHDVEPEVVEPDFTSSQHDSNVDEWPRDSLASVVGWMARPTGFSSPDARHSQNIDARPEVGIVIFDALDHYVLETGVDRRIPVTP